MFKILIPNTENGKFLFTKEELEKLLDETYEEGYNEGKKTCISYPVTYPITYPTKSPYYPTPNTPYDPFYYKVTCNTNNTDNSTIATNTNGEQQI